MKQISFKGEKQLQQLLIILSLFLAVFAPELYAQVTIGSDVPPNNSALLDLKEKNSETSTKGLLLPRVFLQRLDLPNPLLEHKKGMFIYNLTVDQANSLTEGIYFNDGSKWNNVYINTGEDGYTLKNINTLDNYNSVQIAQNDGAGTYNKYVSISSNRWYPIFETSINISSTLNKITINAQIPFQCVITTGTSTAQDFVSYAIGLFIDDKLEAVRVGSHVLSINDSGFNSKEQTVSFTTEGLAIGTKSMKLCFLKRNDNKSGGITMYIASRYPDSGNKVNDFMLKPVMSYYLYEKAVH